MRGRLRLALLASVALATAACRVDVGVDVDVADDGTGRVRVSVALDAAAARAVPELEDQLELDDLRAAGWAVRGPTRSDGGGLVLAAEKRFASPAQAAAVLEEVAGEDGAVRDVVLDHDRSFLADEWSLRGDVDLTGGLEAFSDAALAERLDGYPLGVDVAELERRAGRPLAEAVRFRVEVDLPGADRAAFTPQLGDRLALAADGSVPDRRRAGLLAVSATAAGGLVLLLLARAVGRARAR